MTLAAQLLITVALVHNVHKYRLKLSQAHHWPDRDRCHDCLFNPQPVAQNEAFSLLFSETLNGQNMLLPWQQGGALLQKTVDALVLHESNLRMLIQIEVQRPQESFCWTRAAAVQRPKNPQVEQSIWRTSLGLQPYPQVRWLDPRGTHPNHLRNGGGWRPRG